MFCPNCGSELPDNVAFCNKCGAPLQQNRMPSPPPGQPYGGYQQPPMQGQQGYSQDPYMPPGQPPKKSPLIPILISVLAVGVIAGAILAVVLLTGKDEKEDPTKLVQATAAPATPEATPEPVEETTPAPTEEPTPEPTEEPTPEPTPEPTATPKPTPIPLNKLPVKAAIKHGKSFSTSKKPKMANFRWAARIWNSKAKVKKFFKKGTVIKNYYLLVGGWKRLERTAPGKKDTYWKRLANISYHKYGSSQIKSVKRYYRYYYSTFNYNSEKKYKKTVSYLDLDDVGKNGVYKAKWNMINLKTGKKTGSCKVTFRYVEKGGKQYGLETSKYSDGSCTYTYMVRK